MKISGGGNRSERLIGITGDLDAALARVLQRTLDRLDPRSVESRSRSRTSTRDMSASRRGGQRSGTARTKGRTRDQLYNEGRQLRVRGRSKMSKSQLQRAVDSKKS